MLPAAFELTWSLVTPACLMRASKIMQRCLSCCECCISCRLVVSVSSRQDRSNSGVVTLYSSTRSTFDPDPRGQCGWYLQSTYLSMICLICATFRQAQSRINLRLQPA